jgi:hypothetical protein
MGLIAWLKLQHGKLWRGYLNMLTSQVLASFSAELTKLAGIPLPKLFRAQSNLFRAATKTGVPTNPAHTQFLREQITRKAAGGNAARLLAQAKHTEDFGQFQNLTGSFQNYKTTGRMSALGAPPPSAPML